MKRISKFSSLGDILESWGFCYSHIGHKKFLIPGPEKIIVFTDKHGANWWYFMSDRNKCRFNKNLASLLLYLCFQSRKVCSLEKLKWEILCIVKSAGILSAHNLPFLLFVIMAKMMTWWQVFANYTFRNCRMRFLLQKLWLTREITKLQA